MLLNTRGLRLSRTIGILDGLGVVLECFLYTLGNIRTACANIHELWPYALPWAHDATSSSSPRQMIVQVVFHRAHRQLIDGPSATIGGATNATLVVGPRLT